MTERFALRFAWRFAQARLVHQRRLMPPNASYTALLARLAATRARAARTSSAKSASAFTRSAILRCASGRSPSLSACAHKQTTDAGAAHEASVNIVRSREERAERLAWVRQHVSGTKECRSLCAAQPRRRRDKIRTSGLQIICSAACPASAGPAHRTLECHRNGST